MKLLVLFAVLVAVTPVRSQQQKKKVYPEGTFRHPRPKKINESEATEDISENNSKFKCGRTHQLEGRIFRGENATFGEHPWNAAIFQNDFSLIDTLICGGVLIDENFVLTAANCVAKKRTESLRVKLGEHNIGDQKHRKFPLEVYAVSRKIVHKQYKTLGTGLNLPLNDIALLELDRPVKFKKHILPVCLPPRLAKFDGEIATVSGWGDEMSLQIVPSTLLKQLDVLVVENDACEDWAAEHGGRLKVKETHLCAGFRADGGNICFTDTGGPLILESDGQAQLIGIVSAGIGPFGLLCGMPYFPAIYTNVSNFVDWIDVNTREVQRLEPVPGSTNSSNCSAI